MPESSTAGNKQLEGTLERVVYSEEESGWSVVRLRVPGRFEAVTAVGNLLGVQPGENLRLFGEWTRDRRFGEQFRVDSYQTVLPATVAGIERFLGSGLVPGIGRELARRLVGRFGLETLAIIEGQPQRLAEVPGIGRVRSARIRRAWAEQREIREVMMFLQGEGVSPSLAVRIWKRYGAEAVARVRENPYRLASEVFGIGFKTADRIAANLGHAHDAPARISAGLLYVLSSAGEEGHLFLPDQELRTRAGTLLAVEATACAGPLASLAAAGEVAIEPREEAPSAVYLRPFHIAEVGLAARLRALLVAPLPAPVLDVDSELAAFEAREAVELADEQRAAIRAAMASPLMVVTGGPGTGKTTLVRGLLRLLTQARLSTVLAAPTGRAAKRLAEATGAEAKTLHRLLEFNPRTLRFERGPDRPLDCDAVIIDEVSMLDTLLAYHLLQAVPDGARLILVGDADQLPPVGPGNVLAELLASARVAVVELVQIFRQAAASRIVVNAHRIRRGELPELRAALETSDFFFIDREEPQAAVTTIKELIAERIPRRFGLDPRAEIQVLTPMHRGELGAANLNHELQALLNPSGSALHRGARTLRLGDRVMQLRNNYEFEVFNGDIGRIAAVDEVEQRLTVEFDGRPVVYAVDDLDELALAYACSVHKAQGSEYPCVILALHTQHYALLQRNLVYTAVTRARRLAIVVGSRRALAVAVRNRHLRPRFTRLAERLR